MVQKVMGEMAQYFGDKPNQNSKNEFGYDNSIWQSILQIPYLQNVEEAGLYKTIIHTMWLDAIGWHKTIKTRWPQGTLIGLSDHPISSHLSKLPTRTQIAYIEDLQYLDGIMALTEEERQWYQTVVPSVPVEAVGLPYPVSNHEEHYAKFRDQPKEWIGLGVGGSDNDRNIVSNLFAFAKLQLKNPELVGVFLSVPSDRIQEYAYWADNFNNVFIHERTEMSEYYEMLSRCKFVINLADRNTPGRIQGEGAFFGVPVIGSNRFELQNSLWPQLSVSPFELEKVVEIGQYLLDNPQKAETYIKNAYKNLIQKYDFPASKRKFETLLKRIDDKRS